MCDTVIIPSGYRPFLNIPETQSAIELTRGFFQNRLAEILNLHRVTAPLMVQSGTGINDDLNGVEKPVSFTIRHLPGIQGEIVQSLAKWKRLALAEMSVPQGEGILTEMNALRPDERPDNLHSLYVDQWDWERVIRREDRTPEFLKQAAGLIYQAIRGAEQHLGRHFSFFEPVLPESLTFLHSAELRGLYPHLSPREREIEICREKKAVFLAGIGADLADGLPHDGRAPDYDDWSTPGTEGPGLNGDILLWHETLQTALEISSMGIRVDKETLLRQLEITGTTERKNLRFHRLLLEGRLPLSIGGGIGQSRLCMFLLRKAHIGEVQAGLWPDSDRAACKAGGIPLL
jgi:aspartate--ammonia ligase